MTPTFSSASLNALGKAQVRAYQQWRTVRYLDSAIHCFRAAALSRPGSDEAARALGNLGNSLRIRFNEQTGQASDLEEADRSLRRCLAQPGNTAALQAGYLNALANVCFIRFRCDGHLSRLDESIRLWAESAKLTPDSPGHLLNLALGFRARYSGQHGRADLNAAIECSQQALGLAPESGPTRAQSLNTQGVCLLDRFKLGHDGHDIGTAVALFQEARQAAPSLSSPLLNNLACAYTLRYRWLLSELRPVDEALPDLTAAIATLRSAAANVPKDSARGTRLLANLASALRDRYGHSQSPDDLVAAVEAYEEACRSGMRAATGTTLDAAQRWADWSLERGSWQEAKRASGYGLQALERLQGVSVYRLHKETWLAVGTKVHAQAAFAAFRTGDVRRAVTLLEDGRARLLLETLTRRADLETLRAMGRHDLVERALEASAALEAALDPEEVAETIPESLASRAAADVSETLLRDVLEEMQDVLRPDPQPERLQIDEILALASEQTLVYMAATAGGGLAAIVRPAAASGARVEGVFLPGLTDGEVRLRVRSEVQGVYGGFLGEQATADPSFRETVDRASAWMWGVAMGPIEEVIRRGFPHSPSTGSTSPPDVVLIPCGLLGLLPWHAACDTQAAGAPGGRVYLVDQLRIRYAPSASFLARRSEKDGARRARLLLVWEPAPVSGASLPWATLEAGGIVEAWGSDRVTQCSHEDATVQQVERLLPRHTHFHFAGHAQFDVYSAHKAGLILSGDNILSLADIRRLAIDCRLAVLSACETGVLSLSLPDEVVNLGTAFMEAGAAGVIASLWRVNDKPTASLMEALHRLMCREGVDAAGALRRAQLELRNKGVHPCVWGAFYFTGVPMAVELGTKEGSK
ncbi:MAG: CHAT domain-containing protein [Vicinamibacteria bacterium]